MNHGAHVLVISRDQMLLQTRQLILGTYFQVQTAGRVVEAEALMGKCTFDLVVLCYSLSDDECHQLAALVARQIPPPKILALRVPGNGCVSTIADQMLLVEEGPYALLKKSAEMLGFDLKGKGQVVRA